MIGLIFINDINVCPYIDKYIEQINALEEEYEILIWDRSYTAGKQYKYPNVKVFDLSGREDENHIKKLYHFYKYSRFLKKQLKQNKYDKLIVLSTLSAFVVYKALQKKYKGKYIFDYRDASYEEYGAFSAMLKKIIDNSAFTAISSKGFEQILPEHDYIMAHNFRYHDLEKQITTCPALPEPNHRIRLASIGVLRGVIYNKLLIDIFGKDDRFELCFHGCGSKYDQLVEYAKDIENVKFTGWYDNDQKYIYNEQADIILANYTITYNRKVLTPNRYYDALFFKKPLLGNTDTYIGKKIQEKGLGISLSYDMDAAEYRQKVYDYYCHYDRKELFDADRREIAKILEEDKIYEDKIKEFIRQ